MKELTTEQRLNVFMLYPNAEILVSGHKRTLHSIHVYSGYISYLNMFLDTQSIEPHECQLLLKPLEDITEEDKRELAEIEDYNFDELLDMKVTNSQVIYFEGNAHAGYSIKYMPYNVADYLRSKNYSLPYMGIDLFKAGVAVEDK